jgi:hypothetical protein
MKIIQMPPITSVTDDPDKTALRRQILSQLEGLPDRSLGQLRSLRRSLSRELRLLPGPAMLDLGALLVEDGCARWFTYELVHHHSSAMSTLSVRTLGRLGRDLASWGEVDAFGCYLLGPAWREGRVSNTHVRTWAKSRDRWRRRAALVATVALNTPARGGEGDVPRTLMICDLLVDDRDDMVVKALSWALRALAAREPAAVHAYLAKRESQLAARVLREVRNKLRTGLKNPGGRVATKKIPKKTQK